ncbi:MAG: ABC transporter substrate-binding protein [Rhodospirillaceae bacterium]|nr:ABC transporter substrate-binding protein [Rhodospirillaceae bacterium]
MSRSFRPLWIRLILAAALPGAVSCAPEIGEEAPAPADSALESEVSATEPAATVEATPGVTGERVLFGQSAAFTGPAQELGLGMQTGIRAAFRQANDGGGVHGRILELVSLDDAYEPAAAVVNTLQLIEEEQVFALIGAVGTPTSRSATPVAAEAGVPYIAPFTGAAFLRDPAWDNIINLRASYQQETEEMVARLTGDLGIDRIAVMYQDDSFGRDGYQGVRLALERRGMEPVAIGLYPRNTAAVKTALLDLRQGDPQAVIMIGAYQPVSTLISWARHTGMDAVFLTVSFVGSNALAQALGETGADVVVTQVVPFPTNDSLPVVASYQNALAAHAPDAVPGFVSLEGYLAGRLAIEGLERCGVELSRDCFLDSLRNAGTVDIDGFELRYGDGDSQGSDEVFMTALGADGAYYPVATMQTMAQ